MKRILSLIVLLVTLSANSFAAFPVKKSTAIEITPTALVNNIDAPATAHNSFRTRALKLLSPKFFAQQTDGNEAGKPTKKTSSNLSVWSFGLAMAAMGLEAALIVATFAVVVDPVLLIVLGLAMAGAGVASFVLGIKALVKKQKTKGLAIAGIVLSSGIVLTVILSLIAAVIASVFAL